eukprot:Hpha_TRINITY_DN15110_c0_g2::TRINITY_DN15110_c0_g2_i1::g.127146::m.127146/K14771/NOC4, UTP19; U3 small nucleolar RNA-associated protein 19
MPEKKGLPNAASAGAALRAALKQGGEKEVVAAVQKVVSRCRTAATWDELDAAMSEGFGGMICDLLELPLRENGSSNPAILAVREALLAPYDDLRWWAITAAADAVQLVPPAQTDSFVANLISLVHGLGLLASEPALFFSAQLPGFQKRRERGGKQVSVLHAHEHKHVFERLWLGVLGMKLERGRLLTLLESMHEAIIPHLPDPKVLFDFLSTSYTEGGIVGVLALQALFVLMTKHGLEYPAFFDQLYALMTPDICSLRHRERYFDLASQFLTSVGLGAGTVAAFIKRACRVALLSPTPAAGFLVPFVRYLLLRHPQTMVLVHREGAGVDPWDPEEPDPTKSRALESSAWELSALANHANPTVAHAARLLSAEIKEGPRELENLRRCATRTYARLFTREVLKEVRTGPRAPTAAYTPPPPFKRRRVEGRAPAVDSALADTFAI